MRWSIIGPTVLALSCLGLTIAAIDAAAQGPADLIVTNAKVHTVDDQRPRRPRSP